MPKVVKAPIRTSSDNEPMVIKAGVIPDDQRAAVS